MFLFIQIAVPINHIPKLIYNVLYCIWKTQSIYLVWYFFKPLALQILLSMLGYDHLQQTPLSIIIYFYRLSVWTKGRTRLTFRKQTVIVNVVELNITGVTLLFYLCVCHSLSWSCLHWVLSSMFYFEVTESLYII